MQYNMGYGGMRGGGMHMQHYQQPQPQRAQRRNNGRFRGSRFEGHRQAQPHQNQNQNQHQNQNQNQNQNQRANKEIKTESSPAQQAAQAPVQPVLDAKLENSTAPKPAQAAQPNQPNTNVQNKPQQIIQNNAKNSPVGQDSQVKGNQQNSAIGIKPQQQTTPNKPQQQPIVNKSQQMNINNKPQPQGNMNKPQQQGNMNKPQQQGNMNKPQQGNVNKPQQQSNVNKPQPGILNKLSPGPKPLQSNLNKPQPNNGPKGNNQQGGGGPMRGNLRRGTLGPDKSGGPGGNRDEHFMMSKLKEISGSTIDIPSIDQIEQKFSGRNRLYIGNLTNDVSEQELLDIFNQYGETSELFINKEKNFAFIRIDYKANAEKAKKEVDGRMRRGRPLRVRFAPHNAAIKVKNLTPYVSNELLIRAFEIFGKIERAVVKVDERGKSLGEGIVEFVRKAGAMAAIRHCTEKCFFLTASLRPVVVESFEDADEGDGYTEKSLPRKNQEYTRAREIGPRFAEAGSFEHEYGTRWKQLYELHKKKEDGLKYELQMEEEKLEAQMEYAKYEHETELLREQLRQREQDRERQKRTWEMAERQADEQREKDRETLLRQEEDMAQRMRHQDDELRRRQQENTIFMQAQQLNRILDEQEQGMGGGRGYDNPMQDGKRNNFDNQMNMGGSMQMDTPYMEHYDPMCGHMGYDDGMGRWDSRQEDYPNKRRRY